MKILKSIREAIFSKMAEAKKNYANIENIDALLGGEGVGSLMKNVQITEKKVGDILRRLSSLEAEAARREQAQSAEAEGSSAAEAAEKPRAEEKIETRVENKVENKVPEEAIEKKAEIKAEVKAPEPPKAVEPEKKEPSEAEPVSPAKSEPVAPKEEAREEKPRETPAAKPRTETPARSTTYTNKDGRELPSWNRGPYQGRECTEAAPRENRPAYNSAQGGYGARPQGQGGYNRPDNRPGGYAPRPQGAAGQGRYNTPRPQGAGPRPQNGMGARPARFGGAAAPAPVVPAPSKTHAPAKKKTFEKTYTEQKKTVSRRALVKQQVTVDDFDENKSGYRKMRVKKQKQLSVQTIKIDHAVVTSENIPLKVLSEKLGITAVEITKRLFREGIAKTINDSLDYDTAAYIASDLGIELEYRPEKTAEEVLSDIYKSEQEVVTNYVTRPPVVTVMGHVDHGKTSLLDRIRSANVTAGEAGGITQHIGAYTVNVKGKSITFLDTPGHEAFTAMRARGAQATDIVILVVAADDGIMPQTIEAINHAKAAEVPIIVAVNKMDKQDANVERVKQGLTQNGLVPEEWGGDTILCPVSAKTGDGIDSLLETVNLVAEIRELKANPDQNARGIIIEAKLDKGRGPVASVLIQDGTLKTGDSIISGTTTGRVRAMIDDKGRTVKSAGPSMAVSILGLEDVPNAGDTIIAVEQDKLLKQVLDERKRKESDAMIKSQSRVTLDDVFGKIAEGKVKALNIIVKGDVQGSVEAVRQSLLKLSGEEVRVNVLHSGAGAINETDVMLADSSNAIIVGFNVRPDTKAKALAERSGVDVRSYRIIYELLDDIEKALKGMLSPKFREIMTGKCEVRETFKITGVGLVAGCYVTEGKLVRSGKLRIYRDDIMIVEGNVNQLKRFKDDVKEVSGGFECGLSIEGFNEIRVGDVIECYITEEIPA